MIQHLSLQEKLDCELERLMTILNIDKNLSIRWIPDNKSNLSGEIKGTAIYIYEYNEIIALKTLRHEVIDYLVSQAIEPYKNMTNHLIKMINEHAYKQKEKIVEVLSNLII